MNTFKKLHYGLNFARKIANSHEYNFMKKLVKHPVRHYHVAKNFVKSGGLTDANTYLTISSKLDKINNKTLPKYNDAYTKLSDGLAPNPFHMISHGLNVGSNVSKHIGKGIQRNKKAKSNLEKTANVAKTGLDIYKDYNIGFN